MKRKPGIISKHRQFDPDNGRHLPGECRIFPNSSLRKLMRADRRNEMPDERQVIIDTAMRSAKSRARVYTHSHARMIDIMIGAGPVQRFA